VDSKARAGRLTLWASDGILIDDDLSAEAFCTGLRQLISICKTMQAIFSLATYNEGGIADVAAQDLKTSAGTLYADILRRLLKEKAEGFNSVHVKSSGELFDQS
jgi:hypothetical protein